MAATEDPPTVTAEDATVEEDEPTVSEVLRPAGAIRAWLLSDDGLTDSPGEGEHTYEQRPLSSLGQFELFGLLGGAIETAMTGDRPLNVTALLSMAVPIRGQRFTPQDILDADSAVIAISKLATSSPTLIADLVCVMLNVPHGERGWFTWVMRQPRISTDAGDYLGGGLDLDELVDVFDTFLAQNGKDLRRFFAARLPGLWTNATAAENRGAPAAPSRSSRPTKRSGRRTRG